jgi:6-phosphogluconolactonase
MLQEGCVKTLLLMLVGLAILAGLSCGKENGGSMSYHVYVSNAGSDYFSKFLLDTASGALTQEDNVDLRGQPGAVATNADGSLMYICLRSAKTYQSYRVNKVTGQLDLINKVDVPQGGPYLNTDNTDGYLVATYYGAGAVSVHKINEDGSIGEKPLQWIETEDHAHSIQFDRSNQYAYVPHTNPPNSIYQFKFDESTGELSANDPHKVQPETPEGPRHFVFHPSKDLLYSVNENGSTVSAHNFDANTGQLTSFQVISTLPDDFDGENNTTAEIRMTQDGRFLYASNRGHDSLAIFSVNEDGSLTAEGHQATEATPRYFDFDPTGTYLFAVGQTSGRMATYLVNREDGTLEPMATFEVGDSPLWIQFVPKE